jgi:2-polyprenyl-3-methyl-5-hydroxy-6-metoxy-1,4-benzoquinol methylase
MHRSGTSLVARVLNDCGLYLGPDQELMKPNEDNREGFWENVRFVDLNEALLAALRGAWDRPPVIENGWEELPEIEPLRERALELVAQFRPHEPWGWKDPRSSLTLPFWRRLLPDLTIVACVRDPIEVADSLAARGLLSQHEALELWLTYNRRLVETVPLRELTVVHYDAFFRAPDEEVRRLAHALALTPSNVQMARAALRVNELVRHHEVTDRLSANDQLPGNVVECYAEMRAAAEDASGSPHDRSQMSEPAPRREEVKLPAALAMAQGRDESRLRYTKLDESPGSAHMLLLKLVPEGARVLDVGCATGYLARALTEHRSCRVTGIEISPEAAELARRYCERVIVGDVETLDLESELGDEPFRTVVFGDVLEHLRDPAQTLARVRRVVDDGGSVVASIPNIAHGSVRLALLAGEFRYRELGLLDRTHLRFFTREGVQDMFEESGYVITTWRRRRLKISEAEIDVPASVPDEAYATLAHDPEASTYQFVIRAVRSDAASQLKGLRDVLRDGRKELEALRPVQERVASLEGEIASVEGELTTVRHAHRELQRRIVAERAAFSNHAHELVQKLDPLTEKLAWWTEELAWRTEAMKHQHEEIEWRKRVMEDQEAQLARLAAIESSWAFRHSAPARKIFRRLRPRK